MSNFKILAKSSLSKARLGQIITPAGKITTPLFLPIATRGVVKSLTGKEIKEIGFEMILANTYHLMVKPGLNLIKKVKGLKKFINWRGALLTDSGGFQVFSLSKFRKITKKGVKFRDPHTGKLYFLTPQKAIQIQINLGSDIVMVLDECPSYPSSYPYAKKSLDITYLWAKQSKLYFEKKFKSKKRKPLLFGIIQGSTYKDLRQKAVQDLIKLEFDGYAVGGLAVGEPSSKMFQVLKWVLPFVPEDKPRYLMGVGRPEQIIRAVAQGIDMFDSVIPTRNARHGLIYRFRRKKNINFSLDNNFYEEIKIRHKKYTKNFQPIDKRCQCFTCQNFSLAYLRHLFLINDPLYLRLATIHNLSFFFKFFSQLRDKISNKQF